jgi:peroxiredoxin
VFVITVGSVAPDFALPNQFRETVRLSDFRGRHHVVLAFHPLAFTPICSTQVQGYEREKGTIGSLDAIVLAVSTDAGPSKRAWAESLGGVSYHLLSDFHPQGEVSRHYGVMRDDGLSERAIVIIDKEGIVRRAKLYRMDEQPPIEDVIDALRSL